MWRVDVPLINCMASHLCRVAKCVGKYCNKILMCGLNYSSVWPSKSGLSWWKSLLECSAFSFLQMLFFLKFSAGSLLISLSGTLVPALE